jgi:hypothetical protein
LATNPIAMTASTANSTITQASPNCEFRVGNHYTMTKLASQSTLAAISRSTAPRLGSSGDDALPNADNGAFFDGYT